MTSIRFIFPLIFAGAVLSAAQTPVAKPPVRANAPAQATGAASTPAASTGTLAPNRSLNNGGAVTTAHEPVLANRREPCWQVVGVSQSVMDQRRTLTRQTREQVAAVCGDASLSAAQKRQNIRTLRQQEHQQMESLITPEQQAAVRSCQQQRGMIATGGEEHAVSTAVEPCGGLSILPKHRNLATPATSPATPKN